MTYLDALRLDFAGRFQAAVSTLNNDPTTSIRRPSTGGTGSVRGHVAVAW